MPITHNFVSAVADDPVAVSNGEVVPSDWNEDHVVTSIDATTTGSGTETDEYSYNSFAVTSDTKDANGYKVNGLKVSHTFGGSAAKAGRHAGFFQATQSATTNSSNTDRNYVGVVGVSHSSTGDGGTSGSEKGAYFGANFVGRLVSGATYAYNVTAAEFNTRARTGASVKIKAGIQVHGQDEIQGSTWDCMVSLSNQANATVGWKHGILFSDLASQHPIASTGKLIATEGSATVAYGIDFNSYTFTSAAIRVPSDVEVTDSTKGLILKSPNGTRWRVTINNAGALSTASL